MATTQRSNGELTGDAPSSPAEHSPTKRRRYGRRIVGWAALTFLVLSVLIAAQLALARGALEEGRQQLVAARRALLAGEIEEADAAFSNASAAFSDAGTRTSLPLGWVPLTGNNLDVAHDLASAGEHLSAAGSHLTGVLTDSPGGFDALAPEDGRLPLEAYASFSEAFGAAREEAAAALADVRGAPETFLLPPVAEALWDAEAQTDAAAQALTAADDLSRGLPDFAGADRPRRYLVVAENPAELRGTGGIWGAFAILTFRDGEASFSEVAPIQTLPNVDPDLIPDPSPDFRAIYDRFGGAGEWLNLNMTPDFPSAARAALGNLAVGRDLELDGVIAADPFALASMLRVTGPVEVPGTGVDLTAESAVDFLTNEAYSLYDQQAERKAVLGAASVQVLDRFLSMQGKGLARLRALAEAAGDGHLKIYSTDEDFQAGLEAAGATGALVAEGDVVALTINSGSGNKADYYTTRSLDLRVVLGGDGEAIADLSAEIRNDAPTSGPPPYVLGPIVEGLGPGDLRPITTLFCHAPCELRLAELDGDPVGASTGSELGIDWYRVQQHVHPAGTSERLDLTWSTRGVWEGNSSGGTYRLTFLGQTTIEPTTLQVQIAAPEGTEIVWTSVPMDVDGPLATWEGRPGARLEIEVRFQAPVPVRWWRNGLRLLG